MSALTRTWTSHADIHLKRMVHVVNCFDICQTCDRHVEDAQEASPSQKRHSASRKGSAVSLPLPFEDRFFCDTDVRRCGMCRLPWIYSNVRDVDLDDSIKQVWRAMVFFKAHAAVASGCFEISEK